MAVLWWTRKSTTFTWTRTKTKQTRNTRSSAKWISNRLLQSRSSSHLIMSKLPALQCCHWRFSSQSRQRSAPRVSNLRPIWLSSIPLTRQLLMETSLRVAKATDLEMPIRQIFHHLPSWWRRRDLGWVEFLWLNFFVTFFCWRTKCLTLSVSFFLKGLYDEE